MATYYVDPSAGSDGAAGTSFGAAWATLQKAADTAVAGDLVICCNTATHSPAAKVDFDTNAGTLAAGPITFVAGTSGGTAVYDGSTKFHVDDNSIVTTPLIDFPNTTAKRVRFIGFDFECGVGSATFAVYMGAADSTGDGCIFEYCDFHGASTAGVSCRNASTDASNWFVGCNFYANGTGIVNGASARGQFYCINCTFHDNTSHGADVQQVRCHFFGCSSYDNGGSGFTASATADNCVFVNCTAYGNTGSGLRLSAANMDYPRVVGCSFVGNGAYGVETAEATVALADAFYSHCHFQSNTTAAHEDGTLNTIATGFNHVTGDPLFVSVTDGSEDFHFQDGSPLQDAGPLGDFIGAYPVDPAEIGGGGGLGVSQGLHAIEGGITA